MPKLSITPFKKFFKNLKETFYFTYCLVLQHVYKSRVHDVDDCWTFDTTVNRVQLIAKLM